MSSTQAVAVGKTNKNKFQRKLCDFYYTCIHLQDFCGSNEILHWYEISQNHSLSVLTGYDHILYNSEVIVLLQVFLM